MKLYNSLYFTLIFLLFSLLAETSAGPKTGLPPGQTLKNSEDTVWVFNGEDLSNLKIILDKPINNINEIFSVKNGALCFPAGYKGYIRTKETFSDFELHAEWKWTEKGEGGNSGILVFIQPPDTIWPNCIQVNFKENHAGDLIAMNGAGFKEAEDQPSSTALILSTSSEKTEGEWNTCNVICKSDSIAVYINDVLQNKATKIVNNNGSIGWQLEGKPIALKNIYLLMKK